jgi:hypothetical protein
MRGVDFKRTHTQKENLQMKHNTGDESHEAALPLLSLFVPKDCVQQIWL